MSSGRLALEVKYDIPCVDKVMTCPQVGKDWSLSMAYLVLIKL